MFPEIRHKEHLHKFRFRSVAYLQKDALPVLSGQVRSSGGVCGVPAGKEQETDRETMRTDRPHRGDYLYELRGIRILQNVLSRFPQGCHKIHGGSCPV